MNNLICIATGTFFRVFNERTELTNRAIDLFKSLEIEGVEITFGRILIFTEITKENIEYLNQLKHVSIYSPFGHKYNEGSETQRMIRSMEKFYDFTNSKNIVIHPDQIENYNLFEGMNYSIENLKKNKNIPISHYEKLFNEFLKLKLTLDTSHAISSSKQELEELIAKFSDKIVQIHFHDFKDNDDHHLFI